MRLFGWKIGGNGTVVVYYLSAVVDGNAVSTPFGKMARLTKAYERKLERLHNPKERSYFNEQLNGCTVTCFWCGGGVDALCFLSKGEAMACPDIKTFIPSDIARLDRELRHFPRQ